MDQDKLVITRKRRVAADGMPTARIHQRTYDKVAEIAAEARKPMVDIYDLLIEFATERIEWVDE